MHPAYYCIGGICYLLGRRRRKRNVSLRLAGRRGRRRGPARLPPGGAPPPPGIPVPDDGEFDTTFCFIAPYEECPWGPHTKLLGYTEDGNAVCCFSSDCVYQASAVPCEADAPRCPDGYKERRTLTATCTDGSTYVMKRICCPEEQIGLAAQGQPLPTPSPLGFTR